MSLYIIDVFTIRTLDSIDSLFEDKFFHEILTANEKPQISCICGFTKCLGLFLFREAANTTFKSLV